MHFTIDPRPQSPPAADRTGRWPPGANPRIRWLWPYQAMQALAGWMRQEEVWGMTRMRSRVHRRLAGRGVRGPVWGGGEARRVEGPAPHAALKKRAPPSHALAISAARDRAPGQAASAAFSKKAPRALHKCSLVFFSEPGAAAPAAARETSRG